MTKFLDSVVEALIDVLIDDFGAPPAPAARTQTQQYVMSTVAAVPAHLRLALVGLGLLFGLWSLPRHGRAFPQLDLVHRARQARAWEASPFGPFRAMIAFYRSFAVFGYYSAIYSRHEESSAP